MLDRSSQIDSIRIAPRPHPEVSRPVRLAVSGLFCLLTVACPGEFEQIPGRLPDPRDDEIDTIVYECAGSPADSFEFTIRQRPGDFALWLPFDHEGPYLVLGRDSDQTQVTYRAGDVVLTIGDVAADLSIGRAHYRGCTIDPIRSIWEHAKLTGVDFRAAGRNPDWYAELTDGREMIFAVDADEIQVSVPTPEPNIKPERGQTIYRAEANGRSIVVRIDARTCDPIDRADITGSSVLVLWGGRAFEGCGRPLH